MLERWLLELTNLPTAAGREDRVIDWIAGWVRRRPRLVLRRDAAGNLLITQRGRRSGPRRAPLLITAHLDHPAFVVLEVRGRDVELEFRGGVHDPYFERARLEIFAGAKRHAARIVSLATDATPFKRVVARLQDPGARVAAGDIGRFVVGRDGRVPRIERGLLHTYACDDLAAAVAALSAFELLRRDPRMAHVGLLFTRAEEIGFVGTLAACRIRSVPKDARLICLENSRSFAESPIGGGPIVRVGDRASVFEPTLTNDISALMTEHQAAHPAFRWQRKLMPGGTCEATAFTEFGYRATCLCLPLGNYHNMADIDGVQAGRRPARVGPEFISVADFHGLVEMLVVCARGLDAPRKAPLRGRLDALLRDHGHLVGLAAAVRRG
jgi:endoglucanase